MKKKFFNNLLNYTYMFVIGCFLGYIIEVVHYVIKYHYFVNKQGMIWGPFKPIYGFGLILFTLCLKPVENKKWYHKFIIGFIIGTVYEYFCSFFQEFVFGTYTWTYEGFNLNLNGRVYLPYCFAWGLLALLWIDYGYLLFNRLISKIKTKIYKPLGIVLLVFMSINLMLTALISHRTSERRQNIPAEGIVDKFIDKYYPEELVKKRMPKVRVIKK